ncbi:procathepsin L-like [Panonychus citri]|uniref:procathepsin L-like n=1 Tax=Panonychus citri TaxID=50023 RepID=UPI002307A30E|nr:procathepsin L-like [Panonychus citri]
MFRFVLIAATLTFVACAANFQSEFASFKAKHNKNYAHPKEESYRYQVFAKNLKKINEHNDRHAKGLETYSMGINAFTDMTFDEFSHQYLGLNMSINRAPAPLIHNRNSVSDLPETVDWREKNIVNPIKDQAQCGSCWAFSTIASIESAWAQSKNQLVSLSEQNMMDCSYPQGNKGCSGGLVDNAFGYAIKSGGLDTEDSYPYTATSSKDCKWSKDNVGASISKYVDIPNRDENALKNAVAERVVSVAIHVGDDFQHYKSGIFDMPFCWTITLNHAVALVGYGTDHWILRNSWGTSWGENGYAQYALGKNLCGVANSASYPLV